MSLIIIIAFSTKNSRYSSIKSKLDENKEEEKDDTFSINTKDDFNIEEILSWSTFVIDTKLLELQNRTSPNPITSNYCT